MCCSNEVGDLKHNSSHIAFARCIRLIVWPCVRNESNYNENHSTRVHNQTSGSMHKVDINPFHMCVRFNWEILFRLWSYQCISWTKVSLLIHFSWIWYWLLVNFFIPIFFPKQTNARRVRSFKSFLYRGIEKNMFS